MKKILDCDINDISPNIMLEATPFNKNSKLNFSKKLTTKKFFSDLYVESSTIDDRASVEENKGFDRQIRKRIMEINNPNSKVELIHIEGYAGCGKTTFIHHLLWKLQKGKDVDSLIDFCGEKSVILNYVDLIAKYVLQDVEHNCVIINRMNEIDNFKLRNFGNSIKVFKKIIDGLRLITPDEACIRKLIRERSRNSRSLDEWLQNLIVFDFLWKFVEHIICKISNNIYIIYDNVDSLSSVKEEEIFVGALKCFISDSNYFFDENINNTSSFCGEKIAEIINKTKLVCFLTTRIITTEKILDLHPDLEEVPGWFSITMPENYYNHYDIINKRLSYFKRLGENDDLEILQHLSKIEKITSIFYRNQIFKRLFNGNYRYCINCICDIAAKEHYDSLINECFNLYNDPSDVSDGATGIMLALVLDYLKKHRLYSEKLHLQGAASEEISISRLILTFVKEKNGECSFWDILYNLSHFFDVETICEVVYDLSEAGRSTWRRLLIFSEICPRSYEQFRKQGENFINEQNDKSKYSSIRISLAGLTYLNSIVPRFEFVLSRHKEHTGINTKNYQPLFCANSEDIIDRNASYDSPKYRFERKIDWVYSDVYKHCIKSSAFSKKVLEQLNLNETDYIFNTCYNYQSWSNDREDKQSYESRLIFNHIGYLDRYRRYLLQKYKNFEFRLDINTRLVRIIKRYLDLYRNNELCSQTPNQNEAEVTLSGKIKTIEDKHYTDFTTKIEVP